MSWVGIWLTHAMNWPHPAADNWTCVYERLAMSSLVTYSNSFIKILSNVNVKLCGWSKNQKKERLFEQMINVKYHTTSICYLLILSIFYWRNAYIELWHWIVVNFPLEETMYQYFSQQQVPVLHTKSAQNQKCCRNIIRNFFQMIRFFLQAEGNES